MGTYDPFLESFILVPKALYPLSFSLPLPLPLLGSEILSNGEVGKGREGKGVWDPGQHKEKKIKRSRVPRIPIICLSFPPGFPFLLLQPLKGKLEERKGNLEGKKERK